MLQPYRSFLTYVSQWSPLLNQDRQHNYLCLWIVRKTIFKFDNSMHKKKTCRRSFRYSDESSNNHLSVEKTQQYHGFSSRSCYMMLVFGRFWLRSLLPWDFTAFLSPSLLWKPTKMKVHPKSVLENVEATDLFERIKNVLCFVHQNIIISIVELIICSRIDPKKYAILFPLFSFQVLRDRPSMIRSKRSKLKTSTTTYIVVRSVKKKMTAHCKLSISTSLSASLRQLLLRHLDRESRTWESRKCVFTNRDMKYSTAFDFFLLSLSLSLSL